MYAKPKNNPRKRTLYNKRNNRKNDTSKQIAGKVEKVFEELNENKTGQKSIFHIQPNVRDSIAKNYAKAILEPWTHSPTYKIPGSEKSLSINTKGTITLNILAGQTALYCIAPDAITSGTNAVCFRPEAALFTGVQATSSYGTAKVDLFSSFSMTEIAKFRAVSSYYRIKNITPAIYQSLVLYTNNVSLNVTNSGTVNPDGNLPVPTVDPAVTKLWPEYVTLPSNFNRTPGTFMTNLGSQTVTQRWIPIAHSADSWSSNLIETVGLPYSSDYHALSVMMIMLDNKSSTTQVVQLEAGINYEIKPAISSLAYQSMTSPMESGSHQQTLSYLSQKGAATPLVSSDF